MHIFISVEYVVEGYTLHHGEMGYLSKVEIRMEIRSLSFLNIFTLKHTCIIFAVKKLSTMKFRKNAICEHLEN